MERIKVPLEMPNLKIGSLEHKFEHKLRNWEECSRSIPKMKGFFLSLCVRNFVITGESISKKCLYFFREIGSFSPLLS